MTPFQDFFGTPPAVAASAPGRIHLLGHPDDNPDGRLLTLATPQHTQVAMDIDPSDRPQFLLHAGVGDSAVAFDLQQPPDDPTARRVWHCLREAQTDRERVPPLRIHVDARVPAGVGLAASAALEVATLRALRTLLGVPFDDVTVAKLAGRAEAAREGDARGPHGLLDLIACSLADARRALLVDPIGLQRRLVPLPEGSAVLAIDSGDAAAVDGEAAPRAARASHAAREIGIAKLRDGVDLSTLDALPAALRASARHAVTEDARVVRAAEERSATAFGALMNASHDSRHPPGSSSSADRLVRLTRSHPGVFGARRCGRLCIALCEADATVHIGNAVLRDFRAGGMVGRVLIA